MESERLLLVNEIKRILDGFTNRKLLLLLRFLQGWKNQS